MKRLNHIMASLKITPLAKHQKADVVLLCIASSSSIGGAE